MAVLTVVTIAYAAPGEGEGEEAALAVQTANPVTNGLLEANSNRQVHPFAAEPVESVFTTDGFERFLSSGNLTLYLNREVGAIRILNEKTGYLWGCLPLEEAEGLNETRRMYGNSFVAIECFNEDNAESSFSIGKDGSAQFTETEDGFRCAATFDKVGIAFEIDCKLTDNHLSFELVEGSLREGVGGSTYILKSMTFMPFLGSSYSDTVDGYILIPDGSGSLIRYRQPANYSSTYSARIYGKDLGVEQAQTMAAWNTYAEPQVLMPIYGMVHGAYQNGFLAIVDNGSEYASILAAPAQTNNPYNWASVRFELRQKYVKNINRQQGAGASVPQEFVNPVTPALSFWFLDGDDANYDGMAVFYREKLMEDGILTPLTEQSGEIPMQIEVLGADKKQNFIFTVMETFTTAAQAREIVAELERDGIQNYDIIYRCYTKDNESGEKLLSRLGEPDEFAALKQEVQASGGELYFYLDPLVAAKGQINLRTQAANNLTAMEISFSDYFSTDLRPVNYLYRLETARKHVESALERAYGGQFAIASLGNRLYSDFTSGKEHTRAENLADLLSMAELLTGGDKLPMYEPNQYMWQYADKVYSLPATSSQLIYESDGVPFLQIVLSGCVEPYGKTINISSYSTERLLRQIEYGMAPAFTITYCDSLNMYHTAQAGYFSTCFEDWRGQMAEAYQVISEGLSETWGHSITSHRSVESGIIIVTYDNGMAVYVNYTDEDATVDGFVIPARGFRTEELK
jgi:hypothetical protein